jgi:hypothetical protein
MPLWALKPLDGDSTQSDDNQKRGGERDEMAFQGISALNLFVKGRRCPRASCR